MAMKVFKFDVDEAWAKANNELLKDSRRLVLSAIVFGVLLAIGAVASFLLIDATLARWITTILLGVFALVSFILAAVIPGKTGSAQQLFDTYPLAPAVIAEVNARDIVLMALVNTNVDPQLKPRWGLALRTITKINGHPRKLGTQVPVAAVSGRRSVATQDRWDEITPMPIAWGTPDADVVTTARKAIPQDQWERLERGRKRLAEVKKTRYNLLVLD